MLLIRVAGAGLDMHEEFRSRIVAVADGVARLYVFGKGIDQPATREQKEFIEGIVATDYDGRTLIELLQNGHDAHPADRADGQLEFMLREDEEPWGVLYVANGGRPVRHEDFTAMCRIAMSNKRPDEGIGNKGVGFKSVLQLTDSPEIYSAAEAGSGTFGGYCFRFARPADFDDLAVRVAPGEPGLGDELRENVASLKVPVPLDSRTEVIDEFAARDFVTVVRLALRSPEARDQVQRQLADLMSSEVPFNLFLDRMATVTVTHVSEDQKIRRTVHSRHSVRSFTRDDLTVDEVVLDSEKRFVMLRSRVPEAVVKEAIARSRSDGRISAGWDTWQGDAQVRVALPLETSLAQGQLYTFLPMGEAAPASMAGFVNAPFFARLDRRSLDPTIPLNSLFLDQVALLCARATRLAVHGELGLAPDVIVDLVTWETPDLPRLIGAFEALGDDIREVPFIPALGGRQPRTAIGTGWLWESTARGFTPMAVAATGVDHIIDVGLAPQRRRRLRKLAHDLGLDRTPGDEELAGWAEAVAGVLAREPLDPRAWADFYDDLAKAMTSGAPLMGKRIMLDEHAMVIPAGTRRDGGASVFVSPPLGDGSQAPALSPPLAVAERIAFTHPDIAWRTTGQGRKSQSARSWLEQEDLLQEYRTETVLDLIGSAMQAVDHNDEANLQACLLFAFDVFRSAARSVGADVVARANLLVPAAGGWRPAKGALFGAGWTGPNRNLDDLLVRLLNRRPSSTTFDDLADRLILGPQVLTQGRNDDIEALRIFLEHAGVRHGLIPSGLPKRSFRLSGSRVAAPATAPDFPIDVSAEHQKTWRKVAAQWPRQAITRNMPDYEPTTLVAVLPGQFDYSSLDSVARLVYAELILHGLEHWPDAALEFQYQRPGEWRTVAWPTLLTAFLATADWLPQTTPGRRAELEFLSPARAWWLEAMDTPAFLRAQPANLRNLTTTKVLDRLKKIGIRCWDDPASAADRLVELADVVGSHRLGGRGQPGMAVRKAYETAWRDLAHAEGAVPARERLEVIAARTGRLTVVPVTEGAETVYVADESGVPQERLLQQAPVLMLAIRDRKLAEQVHRLLNTAGGRCLRSTGVAEVIVTIDGMPAEMVPHITLLSAVGRWLTTLVLGVMEFHNRTFPSTTPSQLIHAVQRLDIATLTVAGSVTTSVDGHQVDDPRPARSFLLDSDDTPRLVVTSTSDAPTLSMLQAASQALAELVGMPGMADNLRLAVIDLQQRCADTILPTPVDIAAVLGVTVEDVTALMAEHASDVSHLIPVLACLDVELAEELQGAHDQLDGPDALQAWLTPRLGKHGLTPDVITALADRGDLLEAVHALGVDLATANRGLRTLALPPLHNREGHARQFAAYLQQHGRALQDHIRNAFLPAYRAGEPLETYQHLRQLPGLGPDEAWLDQYWDLPKRLLVDRTQTWLQQAVPELGDAPELPPVEEIREANRRNLSRILSNAVPLVEAWLHRNAAGEGLRPADLTTIADTMTQAGVLDFDRLTSTIVVHWLHANGQWPAGMPLTTNRAELGLTDQDTSEARARIDHAKQQQRQATTFVNLDGKTYSTDTDVNAFADAVRSGITPELLATPVGPLTLVETGYTPVASGRTSPIYSWSAATAPPPETLKAIGLAGEIAAGEWLHHHFGIPPEDSWVSGNRNVLLSDGQGDDSLGYDFRITSSERTRLFEVKATISNHTEFTLGETEVRRAQNLQPDEDYIIIFVTHVLDATQRRIIPLPNPLAPGGLSRYRVAGRSIRLQFVR